MYQGPISWEPPSDIILDSGIRGKYTVGVSPQTQVYFQNETSVWCAASGKQSYTTDPLQ